MQKLKFQSVILNEVKDLGRSLQKLFARFLVSLGMTIIVFSIFLVKPVSAHVLQSNGSVGAVLHIDPADDPIVGEQAAFFFEFKDKKNTFNPANCVCTFSILENGKEIFSQPLFQDNADPSVTNASVFYTFAARDVYQVKVSGKPLMEKKAFEPFTLTYDIRVSRESSGSAPTSSSQNATKEYVPYIALLIGGALVAAIRIWMKKRPRPDINKKK